MKSTVRALLQRGVPSDFANNIASIGYTLDKLKQINTEKLVEMGFSQETADIINKEKRPPIPSNVLNKVLYESNYSCCICKKNKEIIVHHIVPWEESKSHHEDNLVVLCLEHHGEAHTKHELSLNLTRERLLHAKRQWLEEVKEINKNLILDLPKPAFSFFDYFNINRLCELFEQRGINLCELSNYDYLFDAGFINKDGSFKPILKWNVSSRDIKYYWIGFFEGTYINRYIKDGFQSLLKKMDPIILNDIWNKSQIEALITPGVFFVVQGAFYFKNISGKYGGIGQQTKGYRRANGIRIEFEFDSWYCNSSSSKSHLSGRSVITAYCISRSVIKSENELIVFCTVLAIGNGFENITNGRSFISQYVYKDEEEELDEMDFDEHEIE
ncbi:HNH endonuclease signature motif containing protein [Paenibacillus sp. FSL R5-0713]|uniref:HNH endonuclease n=1 Tax=Paenibacillus sp. FSL R5-0713 TaxID=2921655 RepID=UPI0030D7532D